jgi:hypothetical protein
MMAPPGLTIGAAAPRSTTISGGGSAGRAWRRQVDIEVMRVVLSPNYLC